MTIQTAQQLNAILNNIGVVKGHKIVIDSREQASVLIEKIKDKIFELGYTEKLQSIPNCFT